jgi:predicted DNA-binding transcriptional regulator AlpA
MEQQLLLKEDEAAKLLCVSVQLLRKWRANGTGPEHIKLGKCVRYSRIDVDGFISSMKQAGRRAGAVQ